MRFKGDIIITDPCYIIKKSSREKEPYPSREDYYSYEKISDYPDSKVLDSYKHMSKEHLNFLATLFDGYSSKMYNEEEAKYNKAIKEWEENNQDDWEKCGYGSNMKALGIHNYICRDTIYGDWSCTTFDSDTKEPIGEFCADAGMVAVFLLDEVLKYNPDFDYHINRPWTTTLIKDFDGDVHFEVVHKEGYYEEDTEWWEKGDKWEDNQVQVIGKGNINFVGKQTGF